MQALLRQLDRRRLRRLAPWNARDVQPDTERGYDPDADPDTDPPTTPEEIEQDSERDQAEGEGSGGDADEQ